MKRIFTIILVFGLVVCASASCRNRNAHNDVSSDLQQLVQEFGKRPDFHSISLNGLIPALLNGSINLAGKISDDADAKAILDSFDKIRGINVLEYDDASADDKAKFQSRLDEILGEDKLIMEVKDDGDNVRIYSMTQSEEENYLEGIVVSVVSEGVLVALDGKVDISKLAQAISSASND